MVTATFRFFDELNDFLSPERRNREFSCRCAMNATIKHTIEAVGVPHTEVELILINGKPVGFDHLLRDGERVAVYPRSEGVDVNPLQRVRAYPLGMPRFVADSHLGGLAHMLRMMGFDTRYDNGFHDDEIVAIAENEGRIVLSRDRELLKRRNVAHGCYLHALKTEQQLREIAGRLGLLKMAKPFSRCLLCNALLHPVDKKHVLDQLPPGVKENCEHFSKCDECGHVFWEGSHWRNMRRLLDSLQA